MPQPTIPTMQELSRLPRRAVVAFAARCARHVQPIFAAWPGATQEHIAAVDRAISLAEAYGAALAAHAHAAYAANAAAYAANAAAYAAAYATYAAAYAANAVADAANGRKVALAQMADFVRAIIVADQVAAGLEASCD